jgi:hypothetical protein
MRPIVLIRIAKSTQTQGWVTATVKFPFKMPSLSRHEYSYLEDQVRQGILSGCLTVFGPMLYRRETPKPDNDNVQMTLF